MTASGVPISAEGGSTPDREAYLADIVKSRRIQVFCAWCGPVFCVLLFVGWGLMAGFITPLISPAHSAAQVAGAWAPKGMHQSNEPVPPPGNQVPAACGLP